MLALSSGPGRARRRAAAFVAAAVALATVAGTVALPASAGPAPSGTSSVSSGSGPAPPPDLMLPVPTVTIYPGDTVRDAMLRIQAYPQTFRARAAVIDAPQAIVGRTARRMLLPGEPIPVNAIDDPRLVSRGAPTQMIFEENGLVITAVGAPLQNGGLGETIRVRNADTGRIVLGTVLADGRIRIGTN